MSKMTDEQIVKALKHCYEHKSCNDCVGCLGEEECILNVDPAGDIYPVIYRQQSKIEELNVELVGMRGACNSYKIHYDNAKTEIERLNTLISKTNEHRGEVIHAITHIDEIKSEAIKEFAETYTENFIHILNLNCEQIEVARKVKDYLVKEMVGEGNE